MTSIYAKTDDGTITLTIAVPKKNVDEVYKKNVDEAVKHVEIKGFRKGKAPRDLAEKQLDKTKLYEEVVKQIIPQYYSEALKEYKINPIVAPEIKLTKAKEGENWEFTAKTCEKPKVELGDYKAEIQKAKAEFKKDEIWVPGKKEKTKEDESKKREGQLGSILNALVNKVKVVIPAIIIEQEIAKKMTHLVDELAKLGLTVDKYLQTKGKTADQFQKESREEIEKTHKLEFILEELADLEKIVVLESDLQKVLSEVKEKAEKEALERQKYYLASLLRRQKTLDKLLSM